MADVPVKEANQSSTNSRNYRESSPPLQQQCIGYSELQCISYSEA